MGIFDWMKPEGERCPLSSFEVIRRAKDMPAMLRWAMNKHLIVKGPEIWGIHHVFIDSLLNHVVVCLKEDKTTHVFMGIPVGANEWRKYDKGGSLELSKRLDGNVLEWKMYEDYVLYKGTMLPPKDISGEPYWGKVVNIMESFEQLNDEWIVSKIKELYKD